MKTNLLTYLLTYLLILFSFSIKAQNTFTCGVFEEDNTVLNNFQPQNYDPDAKYVLNIFFTFINDDNGQNNANLYFGETYGEYDAMEIIKILNLEFNQFNIFLNIKVFEL